MPFQQRLTPVRAELSEMREKAAALSQARARASLTKEQQADARATIKRQQELVRKQDEVSESYMYARARAVYARYRATETIG
jgi:hypothetical protein